MTDSALVTLFLPFREGHLVWPKDGALFIRARVGAEMHPTEFPGLVCEQTFKPDADALQHAGFKLRADTREFSTILLLPPRQRDESRASMARALELLAPGGHIIACAPNNEGARSNEADLEELCGPVTTLSKHKCRVFWAAPSEDAAQSVLAQQWRKLDDVRSIADGRFVSRPGVFAWDRIDVASELLANALPANLAGSAADLGAGFGYLSVELLTRCHGVSSLDLYEAEKRALDLARENLAAFNTKLGFHWHDVTLGLPRRYDVIVTNPPFHTHSQIERRDIGRRFIAVAADSLNPGGRLWLVANRHLPYETILNEKFGSVRIVEQKHGFKIIEAIKSSSWSSSARS